MKSNQLESDQVPRNHYMRIKAILLAATLLGPSALSASETLDIDSPSKRQPTPNRERGPASPHSENDYLKQAIALRNEKQFRQAIDLLRLAANTYPSSTAIPTELGVTLSWNQQFFAAIDAYNATLRIDPQFLPALLGKGRVLIWSERYRESKNIYDTAAHIDPSHPEIQLGRALLQKKLLHRKRARQLYEGILQSDPNNAEALSELKTLADIWRYEAQIASGIASLQSSTQWSNFVQLNASGLVKLTHRTSIRGNYARQQPQSVRIATDNRVFNHMAEVVIGHKLVRDLLIELGYELSLGGIGTRHRGILGGEWRLSKAWSLPFGLRAGSMHVRAISSLSLADQIGIDLLGHIGLLRTINDRLWFMIQVFGYVSGINAETASGVFTISPKITPNLRARINLSSGAIFRQESEEIPGNEDWQIILSGHVDLNYQILHHLTLSPSYDLIVKPFTRHTAMLSLSYRF